MLVTPIAATSVSQHTATESGKSWTIATVTVTLTTPGATFDNESLTLKYHTDKNGDVSIGVTRLLANCAADYDSVSLSDDGLTLSVVYKTPVPPAHHKNRFDTEHEDPRVIVARLLARVERTYLDALDA